MLTSEEKREWLIKNCCEDSKTINLSNLELQGYKVDLGGLKAETIIQNFQEATEIYQHNCKAKHICQEYNIAETIYQGNHEATSIYQGEHKANFISQNCHVAETIVQEDHTAKKVFQSTHKSNFIEQFNHLAEKIVPQDLRGYEGAYEDDGELLVYRKIRRK